MGSPKKWTKDYVISELRKRASQGLGMCRMDVEREQHMLCVAAELRFGTYVEAIKAAGIPVPVSGRWGTKAKVRLILKRWLATHDPDEEFLRKTQPALHAAVLRLWGSLRAAVRDGENGLRD